MGSRRRLYAARAGVRRHSRLATRGHGPLRATPSHRATHPSDHGLVSSLVRTGIFPLLSEHLIVDPGQGLRRGTDIQIFLGVAPKP